MSGLKRFYRAMMTLGTQPELRRTAECYLPRKPGVVAALGRLQLPDETQQATMRRVLADDLLRCRGLDDPAVIAFLPPPERGQKAEYGGNMTIRMTEDMRDVAKARAAVLGLSFTEYFRAVVARADLLREAGVLIPVPEEERERHIAGLDRLGWWA